MSIFQVEVIIALLVINVMLSLLIIAVNRVAAAISARVIWVEKPTGGRKSHSEFHSDPYGEAFEGDPNPDRRIKTVKE